jgi:hypothetical protein
LQVVRLPKDVCEEFILKKHYSRRVSIFWAGFGLIEDGIIQGVAVYGQPSPPIQRHSFSSRDFRLYELSRVVVQTTTKNAASYLVSHSLKMLESPCAVVSYADSEYGHCGIIYQATNWTYTGATVSHDHAYIIDGKRVHPMSLRDMGITNPKQWARENNIETVKPLPKHRYFCFVGTRRERRRMRSLLKYAEVPEYPKLPQSRYDDGEVLHIELNNLQFAN